jgi:hypothetical protein
MPDDFDPTLEETISYPRKTANSQRETFYPADGNSIVVLYVEVTPAQKAAVRDALIATAGDCEQAKFFKPWVVSSQVGKRAAVHVRAQVHNDIQLGE